MQALAVAGFALNTVGAISQASYQRQAAMEQEKMARLETDSAIEAAKETRESAEEALATAQRDVITQGDQKKSDMARQADMEMASLINIMGSRGQLGTTSFFRQSQALSYFSELDQSRVDQEVGDRVSALQRDKEQVVQDQSRVLNNNSLNYYNASTQSRLQKAQSTRGMFMNIASSAVSIGTKYYQNQSYLDMARRRIPVQEAPYAPYTPPYGLGQYNATN